MKWIPRGKAITREDTGCLNAAERSISDAVRVQAVSKIVIVCEMFSPRYKAAGSAWLGCIQSVRHQAVATLCPGTPLYDSNSGRCEEQQVSYSSGRTKR